MATAPALRLGMLLFTVLLLGCGGASGSVRKGSKAYEHADLRAAMVQWRYVEAREPEMKDKERVRYLVYRGLTHYRVFERTAEPTEEAAALHFLARGQAAYDTGKPRWLDPETVSDMKLALGRLAARAAAGKSGEVVVVDASLPPPQVVVAK